MGLTWKRMPAEGATVLLLLRGEAVMGWVLSRSGLVWSAYEAPKGVPKHQKVNVHTGGRLIGVYPAPEDAMDVTEAKAAHLLRCREEAARK